VKPIRAWTVKSYLNQKDILSLYFFRGTLSEATTGFGLPVKDLVKVEIRPLKKKPRGKK